jgi:GTPase SAR1 family protein
MSPQELSEHLRLKNPLVACPEDNPARVALSDQSGQYVLDEAGNIIGLNLFGMADDDGKATFPCPTEWLGELPKLRYLNLARCGLSACDLSELPDLVVVFLQHNPALSQLNLPEEFGALVRADLSHCGLKAVEWPASPQLDFLNVSRQTDGALTDFQFVGGCPALYFLDLSHNGLSRFTIGNGFGALGMLCLENNKLREVAFAGPLPALESLRLSNNELATVDQNWLDRSPNLLNLFLKDNPIDSRYQTFIEDKSPHEALVALRDVFANEALGTEEDNECKVMLIGNGEAGKSTIVYRLKHDDYKGDYKSTHGVDLFPFDYDPWKLMVWDFGGQDLYHATHRLFLQSNVVYLLVWNTRTDPKNKPFNVIEEDGEKREYRNYSIPYWLHYAKTLGKDSPIHLVQTFTGEDPVDRQPFPNTMSQELEPDSILQIESEADDWEDNGYNDVLRKVSRSIKHLKEKTGSQTAGNFLKMRAWLRGKANQGVKVLPVSDYLEQAEKFEIIGPETVLESWLHGTGVLFYKKDRMADRIILDQEWAIDAIYVLFDREQPHYKALKKKGGIFSGYDLNNIWRDVPGATPELFVEFMLSCEVCFEIDAGEKEFADRLFIAPGLLPEKKLPKVELTWKDVPHWELHFKYDFLHYGVVQSFLVKTHQDADTQLMTQTSTKLTIGPHVVTFSAESGEEYLDRIVVKFGHNDFCRAPVCSENPKRGSG